MNVQRIIGIVLLAVGIFLMILGASTTQKIDEQIMEEITGKSSHTTMWYIIGGAVLAGMGVYLAWFKKGSL